MKLRATIRVRQDFLVSKREELGMTQKKFAEAARVPIALLLRVEKMDFSNPTNAFVAGMKRLADFCCVGLSQIYPKELRGHKMVATKTVVADVPVEKLLSAGQQLALKSPLQIIEEDDLKSNIHRALATLEPRDFRIINQRFGLDGKEPLTGAECASIEGVCKARVGEIEAKALRRLRHPARLKIITG